MTANARLSPWMWLAGWLIFLGMLAMLVNVWFTKQDRPNAHLADSTAKMLVIERSRGAHYVVPGKINGVPVEFLIDTGASNVAIPAEVAQKLDLEIRAEGLSNTANGVTSTQLAIADRVSVGGIELKLIPVSVLPNAAGDEVLLGMSFLKHLDWQQQGSQMILRLPTN